MAQVQRGGKKWEKIISQNKIFQKHCASSCTWVSSPGIRYKQLRGVWRVKKSCWKARTRSKRATHVAWKSSGIQLVQYAYTVRGENNKLTSSGTDKQVRAKLTVTVTTQWSMKIRVVKMSQVTKRHTSFFFLFSLFSASLCTHVPFRQGVMFDWAFSHFYANDEFKRLTSTWMTDSSKRLLRRAWCDISLAPHSNVNN